MNNLLLTKEVQDFIQSNLNVDLPKFLLKKSPFEGITIQEIAQQIKGTKVADKKFPFLSQQNIIFPPQINLEQASSQDVAEFKSTLVQGKSFLDLTCGFGIDAYFLSQNFEKIVLIEENKDLIDIVQHNWKVLHRSAEFHNNNLHYYLNKNTEIFDVIYLDPARRDSAKQKKFLLEDLSPNYLEIQEKLLKMGKLIVIKLSPLIDISYLLSVLQNVIEIKIVALKNEVKEVLVMINPQFETAHPSISAINLLNDEKEFTFSYHKEKESKPKYSEPEKFIYIPNNAVLKSGGFNVLSKMYQIKKLHPNSHFYTSNERIDNFPGRKLECETISSNQIKKGEKFNIISKNYPLKPEEIKKKYGLKDGGKNYLIFTQTVQGKVILQSK